jgi:hypothetical protein
MVMNADKLAYIVMGVIAVCGVILIVGATTIAVVEGINHLQEILS